MNKKLVTHRNEMLFLDVNDRRDAPPPHTTGSLVPRFCRGVYTATSRKLSENQSSPGLPGAALPLLSRRSTALSDRRCVSFAAGPLTACTARGIFTNDDDILARTELQTSTTSDKTPREHCPAQRNQSTLLHDTRTMSGACNQGYSANLSPFPGAAS